MVMLLLLSGLSPFCAPAEKIPKQYQDWLQKQVKYIISNNEKEAFLRLPTDQDRESFIERFWEIRNPTPGAPNNPYKEEHYKRLAHANTYFSNTGTQDGWASDRGRVYITLGAPQQKAKYVAGEVRAMEIWFYSNAHPALPPFFYIVFYENNFGDFRLYSPYMDGPEKLVTSLEAEQGRVAAVKTIDRQLGREVARTTLSLLPNEPVNLDDAVSSLQSDVVLSTIKTLANHPFTIEAINLRRSLAESVTHRVIVPGEFLNVLTVPLKDEAGDINLHYVLRLNSPEDFAVGQADGRYYYSLQASVRVLTPASKLIFEHDKRIARYLSKDEFQRIKNKPFGYEGWLPLAPGKYRLEFTLGNQLKHTAFRRVKEVTIPETPNRGLLIAGVVAFSDADGQNPSEPKLLPFSAGGVKFTPHAGEDLALVPGQDLKVFYQIWSPAADPQAYRGKKLLVDYAFGRPGVGGSAQTVHDQVPQEQIDVHGSLVNGKKIPTLELAPGNYRLAITVADPETQQKTYGSLPFRVVPNSASPSAFWDVYDDQSAQYVNRGLSDYERGLSYLATGDKQQAAECFKKTLQKDSENEKARGRLADLYYSQQAFAKVADLYLRAAASAEVEEQTILQVAESFDKTGNTKKAADWVESALTVKSSSGPLYLALASYYRRLGNSQKAAELERQGKGLMTANPGS